MWVLLLGWLWAKPAENSISLAAQLARDGEIQRAESVLQSINEEKLAQDAALYYVTRGVVLLKKNMAMEALDSFQQAVLRLQEGDDIDPKLLFLYIARCHIILQQPTEALIALQKCDPKRIETSLLLLEAHIQKQDWLSAWGVQHEARKAYPKDLRLQEKEIIVSSKLGLLVAIKDMANELFLSKELQSQQVLYIAHQLRVDGHTNEAALFLELGRYRFSNEDIWKASAIIELEKGNWHQAGTILATLSITDPSYSIEAAQAYLQAGDLERASRYNALAVHSKEKYQQRLSILLQKGNYNVIPALIYTFNRYNLMDDDHIRYGVAYALYHCGTYNAARNWLRGISDPAVFRQAVSLQKAISRCEEGGCG